MLLIIALWNQQKRYSQVTLYFNILNVKFQTAMLRIFKELLPRALGRRRCRSERQTGLHHHVMKGEESS